jgi:dihydropteroate synthase
MPMTKDEFDQWLLEPPASRRPLVMGVLNVTPDSFSDGGRFASPEAAAAHALQLVDDGADLIDIGGESTRPGSRAVDAQEQVRRVLPVFKSLAGRLPAVLSIDTTWQAVAEAAVDSGAHLINDISAGLADPGMLTLAACRGLPIVLMHMQGTPQTMQLDPRYTDVVSEVRDFLIARGQAAQAAGIHPERILFDPGIGFGKAAEHNLTLLRDLRRLADLGRPLLVGTSRKGFIGRITGEVEPAARVMGTAASVAWAVANGAAIVRVHDVEAMSRVVRVVRAIIQGRWP